MRWSARVAIALALLVGAGLATTSPAGAVAGFGDVESERYFTDAVQWMVDQEITTGTAPTCFSPDDPVTRGQAAAFLWRMENEPTSPPHSFVDVGTEWQQGPVSWMAATGITTGTSATTFDPDRVLSRGEMAALLYRLAGQPDVDEWHPFADVDRSWQVAPVSWLHEREITDGTSATTFSPDDQVTRAQLAAFLYRYQGEPSVSVDAEHPAYPWCDDPVVRPDLGGDPWGCTATSETSPSPRTWDCTADLDGDATPESWSCSFSPPALDPTVCTGDVDSSPDVETWECERGDDSDFFEFLYDSSSCAGDIDEDPGDEEWNCVWLYNVELDPTYPDNGILIGCGGPANTSGSGGWGCVSFDGQIDCSGDIAGDRALEHWTCRSAAACVGDQRAALLNLPVFIAVVSS